MKTQYTADKPAKADQGGNPTAKTNSGGGNGLSLVALAVAVAAAGGAWYNNSQLGSQVGQLQQVIDEQKSALTTQLTDQLGQQKEETTTAVSGLSEQASALDGRATSLEEATSNLQGATKALSGDIESARTALTEAMEGKAVELTNALETRSTEMNTALDTRSAELQAQLTEARETLSQSLDSRSQEITGMVETRTTELSNSLQDTQMKLNRNQRSWLLSEVEYLLRTSVHRVMLAGDTDSAVEALKAAKSQLSVLGEVEYLPVSKEIGAEITELRSADQPNIEQLILDLRKLSDDSNKLRIARIEEPAAEEAPAEQATEAKTDSGEGIGSMVSGLFSNIQKHVSVKTPEGTRFGTGDKNAVFAPTTEESTSSELIKLNIQAAQLAALRRDQNDYAAQLEKARANVKAIYDGDSPITSAFITKLDLLTEATVVPYTEKLGGALRLLRETNKKIGAN